MRDFEHSTLWRVSAFERERLRTGHSYFTGLDGPTLLPTTLMADLQRLQQDPTNDDVLEVVAACLRHREPALLVLQLDQLVWPLTVFPAERLVHAPRDLAASDAASLARLQLLSAEPPGLRPPHHWDAERVGLREHYRPLDPLLWRLALDGPRRSVLGEIGGRAAYRLAGGTDMGSLPLQGVLGAALKRLKGETASLAEIAQWPGCSAERACRLVNALYLTQHLLVTRAHPAARHPPGRLRGLFKR